MPLTAPVLLGTNGNTGSSTIGVSPSRNIEVGEFIVVTLTERDWGISSLADNSSQAGTANSYTSNVSKAATYDGFTYIYSCKTTRKILTTDTITATFAGPNDGKSMAVYALPDANASSQLDKTASIGAFGDTSTYSSTGVATTAQADEYAVGVAAYGGSGSSAGTITADSPWTLQYSYKPTDYSAAHGTQVLTATGTPAFSGGWGATMTGAAETACIATFKGTVAAAATSAVPLNARRSRRNPLLSR